MDDEILTVLLLYPFIIGTPHITMKKSITKRTVCLNTCGNILCHAPVAANQFTNSFSRTNNRVDGL